MTRTTQWMQVVSVLEQLGGIAALSQLNRALLSPGGAATKWGTKSPEANIRRIVRNTPSHIHPLKPGLYCLKELASQYEQEYSLPDEGNIPPKVEERNHWYYQGLLVEIGKAQNYKTYVPPQDQNKTYGSQRLGEVCDTTELPEFGYPNLMSNARTVDVIWFNRRDMPAKMFEVEMSTQIINSLTKFNELIDFYIQFKIVSPAPFRRSFEDKLRMDTYYWLQDRVHFIELDKIEKK